MGVEGSWNIPLKLRPQEARIWGLSWVSGITPVFGFQSTLTVSLVLWLWHSREQAGLGRQAGAFESWLCPPPQYLNLE